MLSFQIDFLNLHEILLYLHGAGARGTMWALSGGATPPAPISSAPRPTLPGDPLNAGGVTREATCGRLLLVFV